MEGLWQFAENHGAVLRQMSALPGRRLCDNSGKEYVDFATACYLGLDFDPRCQAAMVAAIGRHGTYQYCSPIFIRPQPQVLLEEALARLTGFEAVIAFPSVTALHCGVLPILACRHDPVVVDEFAHQSIRDALRIPGVRWKIYRHLDLAEARKRLTAKHSKEQPPLLVSDGVFSMSGVIPPVEELRDLISEFGGVLYLDDSHGFGVLGDRGEGLASRVAGHNGTAMYVGTFSKSSGCPVAFVAASKAFVDEVRHTAHTALFSGNVPVPYLETARVALSILSSAEGTALRHGLTARVKSLVSGLQGQGLTVLSGKGGIVAVEVKDLSLFTAIASHLHDNGVVFNPVTFPAIPLGRYRLRFCVSAAHRLEDIDRVLELFSSCAKLRDQDGKLVAAAG